MDQLPRRYFPGSTPLPTQRASPSKYATPLGAHKLNPATRSLKERSESSRGGELFLSSDTANANEAYFASQTTADRKGFNHTLAGVKGRRRHEIMYDGNDRLDVKGPHPDDYLKEPNLRNMQFKPDCEDVYDALINLDRFHDLPIALMLARPEIPADDYPNQKNVKVYTYYSRVVKQSPTLGPLLLRQQEEFQNLVAIPAAAKWATRQAAYDKDCGTEMEPEDPFGIINFDEWVKNNAPERVFPMATLGSELDTHAQDAFSFATSIRSPTPVETIAAEFATLSTEDSSTYSDTSTINKHFFTFEDRDILAAIPHQPIDSRLEISPMVDIWCSVKKVSRGGIALLRIHFEHSGKTGQFLSPQDIFDLLSDENGFTFEDSAYTAYLLRLGCSRRV